MRVDVRVATLLERVAVCRRVRITGLKRDELNGLDVYVVSFEPARERVAILLPTTGRTISVPAVSVCPRVDAAWLNQQNKEREDVVKQLLVYVEADPGLVSPAMRDVLIDSMQTSLVNTFNVCAVAVDASDVDDWVFALTCSTNLRGDDVITLRNTLQILQHGAHAIADERVVRFIAAILSAGSKPWSHYIWRGPMIQWQNTTTVEKYYRDKQKLKTDVCSMCEVALRAAYDMCCSRSELCEIAARALIVPFAGSIMKRLGYTFWLSVFACRLLYKIPHRLSTPELHRLHAVPAVLAAMQIYWGLPCKREMHRELIVPAMYYLAAVSSTTWHLISPETIGYDTIFQIAVNVISSENRDLSDAGLVFISNSLSDACNNSVIAMQNRQVHVRQLLGHGILTNVFVALLKWDTCAQICAIAFETLRRLFLMGHRLSPSCDLDPLIKKEWGTRYINILRLHANHPKVVESVLKHVHALIYMPMTKWIIESSLDEYFSAIEKRGFMHAVISSSGLRAIASVLNSNTCSKDGFNRASFLAMWPAEHYVHRRHRECVDYSEHHADMLSRSGVLAAWVANAANPARAICVKSLDIICAIDVRSRRIVARAYTLPLRDTLARMRLLHGWNGDESLMRQMDTERRASLKSDPSLWIGHNRGFWLFLLSVNFDVFTRIVDLITD